MRFISVAPLAAAAFAAVGASGGAALADPVHAHLRSARAREPGRLFRARRKAPAARCRSTLQEALAKGSVQVVETGRVNELQIENTGGEAVFIQAGDIVKGGKQDRVLTVSLLLPANSGRVPIASFCVEQGRWSPRGKEDHAKFSSAKEAMPSREALLAMAAPPREPAAGAAARPDLRMRQTVRRDRPTSSARASRTRRRASSARSGRRWRQRRRSSPTASAPPSPRRNRPRACSSRWRTRS